MRGSKVNRILPVCASAAWNFPFPSPKKRMSPATVRPDLAGRCTSIFQTILPVWESVAPKRPKGCDPGTLLVNLEPRCRSPVAVGIRSLFPDFVLNVVGSYRVP